MQSRVRAETVATVCCEPFLNFHMIDKRQSRGGKVFSAGCSIDVSRCVWCALFATRCYRKTRLINSVSINDSRLIVPCSLGAFAGISDNHG